VSEPLEPKLKQQVTEHEC
jgi:hypothetical protein